MSILPQQVYLFEKPQFEGIEWEHEYSAKWNRLIAKHVSELNDTGWHVLSVAEIDGHLAITAEYTVPPVIITFKSDTPEEIEEMRQWVIDNYESNINMPVLLPNNVEVIRTASKSVLGVDPLYVSMEALTKLRQDLDKKDGV